jgi:hypothetical protein
MNEKLIQEILKLASTKSTWKEVDKFEAAKDWNEGKDIKLVWNKKPEGVIQNKEEVGKFFSVPSDSFTFNDVIKNGYPHSGLKFFVER